MFRLARHEDENTASDVTNARPQARLSAQGGLYDNHGVGLRALKAPLVTTLFAPCPGFATSVKKNVPVALVAVSVEIVMEPLPAGPAASQLMLGNVPNAPTKGLPSPTVCVPTCAGELKASVVAPGLPGRSVPDTTREFPVAMLAAVIVPDHDTPSIVAVIVPGLRLDPPPAVPPPVLGLPGFPSDPQAGTTSTSARAMAKPAKP
jgi:hypothetical protein